MSDAKDAAQHVPTFGGNPDEDIGICLLEFDSDCDPFTLDAIELSDRVKDHKAEDRYGLFHLALHKEATKFLLVSDFRGQEDYFVLQDAVRNQFSPREQKDASVIRVSLRHRKRKPNERLVKLAQELRLLTTRAYPAAPPDVVEDIAGDAFIDTLGSLTKEKVLDAYPANLEAAQRKP